MSHITINNRDMNEENNTAASDNTHLMNDDPTPLKSFRDKKYKSGEEKLFVIFEKGHLTICMQLIL